MSRQVLKQSFLTVLKSIENCKELMESQDIVDALIDKLSNEPTNHPTSFADYLQQQCLFTPKVIISIINGLISQSNMIQNCNKKICSLWLLFSIYEQLGIHTNRPKQNKDKRRAVNKAYLKYNFIGSNLTGLLKACTQALGESVVEQQIKDLINMIGINPGVNIQRLFNKDREIEQQQLRAADYDKGLQQQLKDMINDYKNFPQGSLEKDLQGQIILAHIKRHKSGYNKLHQQLPKIKLQTDLIMMKKKFLEQTSLSPQEIEDLFRRAENNELYEALCTLKSKLSILNVLELERLINKTNDAQKQIEGKDVIFIMGNTGSGKTTCVLKFLGYQLTYGTFDNLPTLIPSEQLKQEHKTFYTSPEGKSCTRYINAVSVPSKMYKRGISEHKMSLVICDSPGFGDSAGVEVDIANGVGMINALYKARSVRVVVILPYESLVVDRMVGAIKMGEIVSNLFYELTVLDSLAIFFNKVTADKIEVLPKMIENKLKNLNEIEKSNKKLITFLQQIYDRSKDVNNFIDPIKGDFKDLFNRIFSIPPIIKVRQNFQYDFTESTKSKIQKFVQLQRTKVREQFQARNYSISQFHLKMIETMMSILHNDNNIKRCYHELTRFVKQESEKQIILFEEIIYQIMNSRDTKALKRKLDDSKKRIIQIEKLFKGFQGLNVIEAGKIEQIIEVRKNRLLEQFKSLDKITIETIMAAKSFAALIDHSIEVNLVALIEKRFNQVYLEADRKVKNKKFSEMGEMIKYLVNLASYITQLIQKDEINNTASRLRNLKTAIAEEAELALTQIAENITKEDARIMESTVKSAKMKIDRVKEIEALKFLDNNEQIKNRLTTELRRIQEKCRKIIRELENLRLTLSDDAQSKQTLENEELKKKKRQIQMMMKIQNLAENLADDYQYAKQSIGNRLRENVSILKNCIANLQNNKSDEINKNLNNIKKAISMVLQCSNILDNTDGLEIAQSIAKEFIDYLEGVKNGLHTVQFRLNQINSETFRRIQQYYSKIESYGKLGNMGGVQSAVKQLKKELIQRLKAPFAEFYTSELQILREKNHYKYIKYDKLEKFSTYALDLYEIVSNQQYTEISECETDIKADLEPFFKCMEDETEAFVNLSFQNQVIQPYLKELVKALLCLCQKIKTCEYLNQKLNFEVHEKLEIIQGKLDELKDKMQIIFEETQANAEELQLLLADSKQLAEIEDLYKSKGKPQNKFGFRDLQRKCNEQFMKILKSDEQRCKQIFKESKLTKIQFKQLQEYYQKFINLNTPEGIRKRRVITSELKKVEQKTISELNNFRQDIENLSFVNNSSDIDEFLEVFNQAVQLERNLSILYTVQEDKSQIQIKKKDIHKIGLKIISVFQSEFEIVIDLLNSFDLNNINEKLKTFGQLESIIYQIFNLDNQDLEIRQQKIEKIEFMGEYPCLTQKLIRQIQGASTVTREERLTNFIKNSVTYLRQMIQSHPYIKETKFPAKNVKRLKNLLQVLKRGVQIQIKAKYQNLGPFFIIDKDFQSFYSHCNEKKRKELSLNVEKYLQDQYNDFKEKYNCQKDVVDGIKKNIEDKIKLLPSGLKGTHNKKFEQIKKILIKQNDELITNVTKSIITDPVSIANFFIHADKARNNGQQDLHKKWVRRLAEVYKQVEKREMSLQQKICFIENSLIDVYLRHKEYLTADALMFEQLKRMYVFWIGHLGRIGQDAMREIHQIVAMIGENPKKKMQDYKSIINVIFKVYHFLLKLRDDVIIDQREFRHNFFKQYQEGLNEVVRCYNETLKMQPAQKLNSKDVLDSVKMRTLQNYIENVTSMGAIIDQIGAQLNLSKSNNMVASNILSLLKTIEPYDPIIESYEVTIGEMLKLIANFEFWTDMKRNMDSKQIQQDLNQLDRYFEILQLRQEFFMKYIIKRTENRYNFTSLSNNLLNKFKEYFDSVIEQINDTFKRIDGEPAVKINLLIIQLKILRERDNFKFISLAKVKEYSDIATKLLKNKFDQQREICKNSLEIAEIKFTDIFRQVKILESKRRQEAEVERKRYKSILQTKISDLKRKYNDLINIQQEDSVKQIYKNSLANEQNSSRNQNQDERDKKIKIIEDQCESRVKALNEMLKQPVFSFTSAITILQKALMDIYIQAQRYKNHLESVLNNLAKANPKLIALFEGYLRDNSYDHRSIGSVIIGNSKVFANCNIARINKLIKGQDINYVLKHLQRFSISQRQKLSDDEMRNIQNLYKAFKLKYDQHKQRYISNPTQTTINYMITPLKDLGTLIKQEFYQTINPLRQAKKKVELLAGIFALWAILKAETFQGEVQYTIQPHPTQITTLILLLGISHPNEKQSNRLAQVGTGEGKSIVLAGLSSYLALVGFKVRCACYSAYLSRRDQQSFKLLFQRLGIENNIKYGTFNDLCQDILNGGGANLKDEVEKMMLQPPQGILQKFTNAIGFNFISLNRGPNEIINNPTILVIDEVDVFFQDNFFGSSYCPAISLRSPAVSNFLQYVWRQVQAKGQDTDPKNLIKSEQFEQLKKRYPSLKRLLKNQVHGIVAGALNFKHNYYIIDKRIAYKDNDTISYRINYGYKTVFAYLYEYQQNKVSKAYLDEALQISLMIAEFSYAGLPNYFSNILGVTGTLEVLPHYKKYQLSERYKIKDQYSIPSAFGINEKRTEQYHLVRTQNYNKVIVELINKVKDNRPIIIFFKGSRELNEFFCCPEYQPFLKRTYNLTEEHDNSVRDSRIFNAVEPNKITLMSSVFGRGTDFVIRDDHIKEKGGIHIIQAFLSLDQSEEVQIKGRTARQNGQGSYDCVIDEAWLEQLGLNTANFPKNSRSADIHNILLRAREYRMGKLSQSAMNMLSQADRRHNNVVQIFSKQKLAQSDLIDYVYSLNYYPEMRKVTIKTVIGLDATGSMRAALKKTCQIIGAAFQRNYKVLKQKDEKATIEVKIMIYRNYNSDSQQIIEATTFENTPVNLKRFLERVQPKGGWGNEAVQVLFQFLNMQQKIDQVILIGDAAPNTASDVISKRNYRGEPYWLSKGFPLTNFQKEMDTFKNTKKNCPVHCFYLGDQCTFEDISRQTGGKCSPFKLDSVRAADHLTDFVVTNILNLIEVKSERVGLNLVEAYRKMFAN